MVLVVTRWEMADGGLHPNEILANVNEDNIHIESPTHWLYSDPDILSREKILQSLQEEVTTLTVLAQNKGIPSSITKSLTIMSQK